LTPLKNKLNKYFGSPMTQNILSYIFSNAVFLLSHLIKKINKKVHYLIFNIQYYYLLLYY